ncbi:hypothetical protein CVT25_002010 [Psilocybe cyanescens]|uniref:Uncharacterized protein n=1 Tax=Psilocybe cyanescens TaxID=93625 RepID=A0A409XF01_PSICY|nr:hypothetical protein CVT25_002010 [Psilocybe cyanescens]
MTGTSKCMRPRRSGANSGSSRLRWSEEAEVPHMTQEQRQLLMQPFSTVKAEFVDLDGLRWTQTALRKLLFVPCVLINILCPLKPRSSAARQWQCQWPSASPLPPLFRACRSRPPCPPPPLPPIPYPRPSLRPCQPRILHIAIETAPARAPTSKVSSQPQPQPFQALRNPSHGLGLAGGDGSERGALPLPLMPSGLWISDDAMRGLCIDGDECEDPGEDGDDEHEDEDRWDDEEYKDNDDDITEVNFPASTLTSCPWSIQGHTPAHTSTPLSLPSPPGLTPAPTYRPPSPSEHMHTHVFEQGHGPRSNSNPIVEGETNAAVAYHHHRHEREREHSVREREHERGLPFPLRV